VSYELVRLMGGEMRYVFVATYTIPLLMM